MAVVVAAQVRSTRLLHRHRSRHRLLLRLVARADARSGAFVVDHPVAAAYCVPGRSDCVVVSTGAITALTSPELTAVLAHEHAHARRYHHLAIAPFHALSRATPFRGAWSPASPTTSTCSSRCAPTTTPPDATAPQNLVSALRRFHELGHDSTPPGTLAAAGHAVALRMQRLTDEHQPPPRTLRGVLIVVAFAVATTPSSLFLLPA